MTADHQLPSGVALVRTTQLFNSETVPAGLRRAHRIADGVWGRLVVHSGALDFVFEDDATRPTRLDAGETLVIPPGTPHHVVVDEPVSFVIEFYR